MTDINPTHVRVISTYGAPMGRPSRLTDGPSEKLYLRRVILDAGGYDKGGAYWGIATRGGPGHLYIAFSETFTAYVRAWDHASAKAKVLELAPHATFWR